MNDNHFPGLGGVVGRFEGHRVVQGSSGLGGPLALAQAVAHQGAAAKQIGVGITAQTGQPTPSLRRVDPEMLPGGSRTSVAGTVAGPECTVARPPTSPSDPADVGHFAACRSGGDYWNGTSVDEVQGLDRVGGERGLGPLTGRRVR